MKLNNQKSKKVIDLDVHDENPNIQLVAGSIKGAMRLAGASSRDLWYVPREGLRILEGFNVRIHNEAYFAHIRFLANSMKMEGFKPSSPLSGYVVNDESGGYIIINDGHCRMAAYDLAVSEGCELGMLPVVVSTKARDIEDLTVALATSNTGKPLEPLEKASVCKRLVLYGWTEEDIAQRLQISLNYVRELLTLIGAPREVRDMVASEAVSATTAIQALKLHGANALQVLSKGLATAQRQGKSKVTNRFIADPRTRFVRKSAMGFFSAVEQVRQDPAFEALAEDTRKLLVDLIEKIEHSASKSRDKAVKKTAQDKSGGN